MDEYESATNGIKFGNKMKKNDGTDDVPHIENKDMVAITTYTTNPGTNGLGRVIETLP